MRDLVVNRASSLASMILPIVLLLSISCKSGPHAAVVAYAKRMQAWNTGSARSLPLSPEVGSVADLRENLRMLESISPPPVLRAEHTLLVSRFREVVLAKERPESLAARDWEAKDIPVCGDFAPRSTAAPNELVLACGMLRAAEERYFEYRDGAYREALVNACGLDLEPTPLASAVADAAWEACASR